MNIATSGQSSGDSSPSDNSVAPVVGWDTYIRKRTPHLVHILDRHGLVALMAHVLSIEMQLAAAVQDEGYSLPVDLVTALSGSVPELSGPCPTPDMVEIHILCLQADVEHVVLEDGTSLVGDLSSLTDSQP